MGKRGEVGARVTVSLDSLIFRVFDVRKETEKVRVLVRIRVRKKYRHFQYGYGNGYGFLSLEGTEIWTGYGLI